MAASDSCLKKNTASQHCSPCFLRNALLEFRTNIRGLGTLRECLAEEKPPATIPFETPMPVFSLLSPTPWQGGRAARLFSLPIRWSSQPACLNAAVEGRRTTGFCFAPEGASLTYFTHRRNITFVILLGKYMPLQHRWLSYKIPHQGWERKERKATPITKVTLSRTHLLFHHAPERSSLGIRYFRQEKGVPFFRDEVACL